MAPANPDYLEYLLNPVTMAAQEAEVGESLGGLVAVQDFPVADRAQVPAKPNRALPASYDLRTLNRVTSVKDQGDFGTCWAHAACGSLESCLLPGETNDFSEDNMVLTSGFTLPGIRYDAGGHYAMSTAYLARWGGPVNQSEDAYGDDYTPVGLSARKHAQEVLWFWGRASELDNDAIKNAVMTYGAVDVAMSWQGSSDGSDFYNPTTHSYYYDGYEDPNHEVLIVGWDDSYSAGNFATTPSGDGAFIVKNSWGTDWGDGGYFYVSYYDQMFGWSDGNRLAVFNNAESTSNYTGIYQYDPLGYCNCIRYKADPTVAWFANTFTAQGNGAVRAVGFYTQAPGTSYEVYTGSSLATKTLSTSGSFPCMGYHTVALPTQMNITGGQPFVVAVKVVSPDEDGYPITIERPEAEYSDNATAAAGQSYISPNGSTWMNVTTGTGMANANVCLKAYANHAPAISGFNPVAGPVGTPVTLTGTDFAGTTSVAFNGTAATFNVDSSTQITTTVPAGASTGPISVTTPNGTASSSASFTVTGFTPKITLTLTGLKGGAVKLGKKVTVKGTLTPASLAGEKVSITVQRKKGSKWVKAKATSAKTNTTGAYAWKYKPTKKGKYRVQTAVPQTNLHKAARSPWRPFKVK